MVTGNTKFWLGVFFCTVGCVCNSSALGAEGDTQANTGEPIPPATTPALFETASEDEALPQGQQVEVGSFGQIDLHVKDLDLTKVLQLLSIQSQRNIIASRNVAGTVSADLYGVDFYEALDAILSTNGFGYREKGQFIYVYTAEEIAQLEDENRELVYEVVHLNYINAADASAFASPLLSGAGSIALSGEVEDGFEPTLSDAGSNQSAHQDTLLIRDYAENVEEILAVIERLDTRPKQVQIDATILQARLTEANAFGVDFAVFADLNLTDFTTPLGAVDELITGTGPNGVFDSGSSVTTSPGNVAKGQSSVKFGVVGSDAAVFVRALDSVTDTTVLAKPSVLVLNRNRVNLLVGERLGYLSTTATETSNTQTVEFLDVGTQLTVRPFVSDDDFVRMELRPSVSDGSTNLVGGFVIPDTTTQELVSNVIVKSGQTVVLGGLFKEDTTIGRTQVPGVGNIPILGNAFKGQDDSVTRSEVIFMIKPTVMKDKDLTQIAGSVSGDIESARTGTRNGLLPWSRTKLTSRYMTDAIKYKEAGNNEKALWSIDKALYLDPTMADALQLKAEITGEKNYFYDRSMLKKAVDSVIDAEISVNADEAQESTDEGQLESSLNDELSTEPAADADAGAEAIEQNASNVIPADLQPEQDQVEQDAQAQAQAEQEAQAQPQGWTDSESQVQSQTQDGWEIEAPSDTLEPAATEASFDQAEDGFEFAEPSGQWDEPASTEQAEAQTEVSDPPQGLSEETASTEPAQDEQAVEAPWRVEIDADGSDWQSAQTEPDESLEPWSDDAEVDDASVEVYDPDEFFADTKLEEEAAQAEQDQPVNIFEFVEEHLGGEAEADAADETQSEGEVTSVDTDEVNE